MSVLNVSTPTKDQVIHGAERTALVFVLTFATYLDKTGDPLSKAALSAAFFAGVTAAFQAVLSTLTDL